MKTFTAVKNTLPEHEVLSHGFWSHIVGHLSFAFLLLSTVVLASKSFFFGPWGSVKKVTRNEWLFPPGRSEVFGPTSVATLFVVSH